MTQPVAGYTPPTMTIAQATATSTSGGSSTAKSGTDALGSDAFLKLLVAQLKYQDPSKPVDSTALMGQTAQFQMVDKLQQLFDQNTQLLGENQANSAIALVGRKVSYTQGGHTLTGVVGSVRLSAGGPVLVLGSAEVQLSAVTEISSAG